MKTLLTLILGVLLVVISITILFQTIEGNRFCNSVRIESRQALIEAHEQCVLDAKCFYTATNIANYNMRIAKREECLEK